MGNYKLATTDQKELLNLILQFNEKIIELTDKELKLIESLSSDREQFYDLTIEGYRIVLSNKNEIDKKVMINILERIRFDINLEIKHKEYFKNILLELYPDTDID